MAKFQRDFVTELKTRVDLHDVVAPYVNLKRAGSSWKGLSPFKQEKTPSFLVHPDKGFFKCFSSGEAGDAISFIQKVENLDFQEAVEYIANRFNVPIRYEESSSGGTSPNVVSNRRTLFEIHELAASWYRGRFLEESPEGKFIRDYWTQERGFTLEIAEEFGIGFAPPDCSGLEKLFQSKNFPNEVLDKCGLFFERRGRSAFMPRFRGRLMIPIRDNQERVVAFTARQLSVTPANDPAREAKYVNSPETTIFSKGNILFNLDKARRNVNENEKFLLVEGQLDAIRCWGKGAKTVVAPQGTAFTEGQAYLLKRFRPAGVECLLDGDEAGRKAAMRMFPILVKSGIEPSFLILDPGQDPDELLRVGGSAALEKIRSQAKSGIDFAIRMQIEENKELTPTRKTTILENIFAVISETDSLIARDEYLSQAVNILKVDESSARHELNRFLKLRAKSRSYSAHEESAAKEFGENDSGKLTTVEDDLLFLLLHHDKIAFPLAQVVDPEWLDRNSDSGRILAKAVAEIREGDWRGTESLDELLEEEQEKRKAYSLLSRSSTHDKNESYVQACNSCLSTLFLRHLSKCESDVRERFANFGNEGKEKLELLRKELSDLREKRKVSPILNLSSPSSPNSHPINDHDQSKTSSFESKENHRPENRVQKETGNEEGNGRQESPDSEKEGSKANGRQEGRSIIREERNDAEEYVF